MSYNTKLQSNITDLQNILARVNELPEMSKPFPNGKVWTQSNLTSGLLSLHYANGLWVAGGYSSGLYYSTDGKIWTQSSITSGSVDSVHYANGLWVAGSRQDGLLYSSDGINWSQSNLTTGVTYQTIYYANNIALWLVGQGGFIHYSADGRIWTSVEVAANTWSKFSDICSIKNLVVAVDSDQVYYSTDGMNWTVCNVGVSDSSFNPTCICYANGLMVLGNTSSGPWYSTDGIVWTLGDGTVLDTNIIHYANGVWVAGCGSMEPGVYYSTDAHNWTMSNLSTVTGYDVVCSNGIWVLISYYNSLYYSYDGMNWFLSNIDINKSSFFSTPMVRNANGIWVAATINGLYYSPTWEPTT